MINKLTVFYDSRCGFCRECAKWLETQDQLIPLELLPTDSPEGEARYPGVALDQELTVISDEGGIYRGSDAWIMSFYALDRYRAWSLRLASPLLRPIARTAFQLLSNNRTTISIILGLRDVELAHQLRNSTPPICAIEDTRK